MHRALEDFLLAWDRAYREAASAIPLFQPGATRSWSPTERQYFVEVFYHLRAHAGEVLWALGSSAKEASFKEAILEEIKDALGNGGPSRERIYLDAARALGCSLATEYVRPRRYLAFARSYNDLQLQAIAIQDEKYSIMGFAAGRRLNGLEHEALERLFESLGLSGRQLDFIEPRERCERSFGMMTESLRRTWSENPGLVAAVFDRVSQIQLAMWRELSSAVLGGDAHRPRAADESPAVAREADEAGQILAKRQPHYDPSRSPALRSRYADIVALESGDRGHLDLVLDERARRVIGEARGRTDWGRDVLVLGGNGFVGAHMVHRLLADRRVKRVRALVRSRPQTTPRERVLGTWEKYELSRSTVDLNKLVVLDGSAWARWFGMSEEDYGALAREVDTVIDCAGSIDYTNSYLDLRSNWVLGLLGVLQFCLDQKPKQVTYLGSAIAHLYDEEADFRRPDSWWYSGYAQVKWVNQTMLGSLARAGMRALLCEAPHVLGSTTVGKDPGFLYSFWRGIRLGVMMRLAWDGPFPDFAPVDVLVDATVENTLAVDPAPVLRPIAPYGLRFADLAPMLDCRVVSWTEFVREVRKLASPAQMRMLPEDSPEVIVRTKLQPIYPPGYDLSRFPPSHELAGLYLRRLSLLPPSG